MPWPVLRLRQVPMTDRNQRADGVSHEFGTRDDNGNKVRFYPAPDEGRPLTVMPHFMVGAQGIVYATARIRQAVPCSGG